MADSRSRDYDRRTEAVWNLHRQSKECVHGDPNGVGAEIHVAADRRQTDDAIAMLADDVVSSNPMTGTQTGKAAVEAGIRGQPAGGGGFNITWGEPMVEGNTVSIVGT